MLYNNILEAVGHTPMVRLNKMVDETMAEILVKFEAVNVGGSIEEGLMCGISSGTNVAAAIQLAKKLGPGKTVVTVLPDTAERYFSTHLFEE